MVFILDPMFCTTAKNFVSSVFLSASIYFSFGLPMIHVLNKIDAIPREKVEKIEGWSESFDSLIIDLENSMESTARILSREVAEAIHDIIISMPIIPVSSTTMEGFPDLHATITKFLSEGEMELR